MTFIFFLYFSVRYEDEDGTITVLGSPIQFEPSELDFREQ